MKEIPNPFFWQRRLTREVKVGEVGVGGENPIRIQTMLTSDTMNTEACVKESIPILEAGCEILRITAPSIRDAKNLKNIVAELRRRGFHVPIVADIHFVPAAALEAALWCEKVRINPGNFADRKKFQVREYSDDEYAAELERLDKAFSPLVLTCKGLGRSLRIGVNHGSLSDRIMNRYGDTPLGMVESALEFIGICRRHDYHQVIFSMKASNPKVMIEAYRLLVARLNDAGPDWNYPLHLGVTEAGEGEDGRIKSAIGIGALLEDGLGDTVRVSLTEDSVHEIPVCQELVRKYDALWERQRQGRLPTRPALRLTEKRNPFVYARRPVAELTVGGLRMGGEYPPRVEVPVPLDVSVAEIQRITTAEPDAFAELLQFPVASADELEALAGKVRQLREQRVFTPIVVRAPSAAVAESFLGRSELMAKLNVPCDGTTDVERLLEAVAARSPALAIQFDVGEDDPEALVSACQRLAAALAKHPSVPVILAVRRAGGLDLIGAYRVLVAAVDVLPRALPILLRDQIGPRPKARAAGPLIAASTRIGSLLCDGIGDAVEITSEESPRAAVRLAYNILQAAGARTFKTDYVACPSCGRTLFDLQAVTARIKSRTAHLKGVKIAIMGCIVNGPGEMADADFGYVGTAPGRVSLWVGKSQVKQHIAEDQAVEELIGLIKEHGRWIDPTGIAAPADPQPGPVAS